MTVKIKSIRIESFRGILSLPMALNGNSLLIRGENGTGKSSFVDSLEYFFTGNVKRFDTAKSISFKKHGPHVTKKIKDIRIEVEFNPGNIDIVRTHDSFTEIPASFQSYFRIPQEGSFILRRDQLLAFIICTPANRYKAIGDILGIQDLDEMELELKRAFDSKKAEETQLKTRLSEQYDEISSSLNNSIESVPQILPSLNRLLVENKLEPIEDIQQLEIRLEELITTTPDKEKLDTHVALCKLIDELKKCQMSESLSEEVSTVNLMIEYVQDERRLSLLKISNLLKAGAEVLSEDDSWTVCPLCEQNIESNLLLANVKQRIEKYQEVSQHASDIREHLQTINQYIDKYDKSITDVIELSSKHDFLSEEGSTLHALSEEIKSVRTMLSAALNLDAKVDMDSISTIIAKGEVLVKVLYNKTTDELSSIGISKADTERATLVKSLNRIELLTTQIESSGKELDTVTAQVHLTRQLSESFTKVKKQVVGDIYSSIQDTVEEYFQILHPGESHANICIEIKEARRASAALTLDSFGRCEEDPRGLLSEGHMDSLGLCVFLGFVKHFNTGCSLLVLDDVVTTIDAQHRSKIGNLLFEEFKDYQLIITTHDNMWYKQLLEAQKVHGLEGRFENHEITCWDLERGPILKKIIPSWDSISDKLDSGDKRGAGNEGRTYLESFLKRACILTVTPLIVKPDNNHTVSEMLQPLEKRLKKKLNEGPFKTSLVNSFDALKLSNLPGNITSHDNPLFNDLSLSEVREYCEAVKGLKETLSCPSCSSMLTIVRETREYRCTSSSCTEPLIEKIS